MNTQRIRLLILVIVLISLITACGGDTTGAVTATTAPKPPAPGIAITTKSAPTVAAPMVSAPTVAATSQSVAASTAAPTLSATVEGKGFITGHIQLMSPPTPVMFVYALDSAKQVWTMVQTQPAAGPAAFTLEVPPGSYQVFAAAESWPMVGVGYSPDGTLTNIAVAAGQTVADIIVRSPSQGDCGQMPGYPASPDGRFAGVAGPTPECLARFTRPPLATNPTRIQFASGATSARVTGSLAPGQVQSYAIKVTAGQTLTLSLTGRLGDKPIEGSAIPWLLRGADGLLIADAWSTSPLVPAAQSTASTFESKLPRTEDYYIDVARPALENGADAIAQSPLNYTLEVGVPTDGSAQPRATESAAGGNYQPVSLAVCQTLQQDATQTLAVNFTLEADAPFADPVSAATGRGCTLTATGTGTDFSDPGQMVADLVKAFVGWTEQIDHQAGGPTGAATGMTRDMGLLLISAQWTPAPEVQCPSDQPISACNLTPEQKHYTVQIQAAQK